MRNFDYSELAKRSWDSEIIGLVAQIHEYKGRQELYLKQKPAELDRLIEVAKVQSTETSNEIEGIRTTNTRLLQTILAAYRDFEERVSLVGEKLPAIETVRRAVYNKIGKFTKSEVMELCPTLSKASVENSIKQLVEQGLLLKHGSGRSTFYTRSDI